MNLNLRHLELFYFVARFGGLAEAARKMPYRMERSGISRQLCQLERDIALALYQRHPFKLTPAGQTVFTLIKPVFEDLPAALQKLRHGDPDIVRVAASTIVLRDYLPSILPSVQESFPSLRLTFREGLQSQIETWLKDRAVDLAVTLLHGELPAHYQSEPLLRLPLVLLVPEHSRLRSAQQLWQMRTIPEQLICPPADEVISRLFRQGLHRLGIEWPLKLEANSIALVETYVEKGFGVGVAVALPGRPVRPGLRALPLTDFPHVPVGMIWQRDPVCAVSVLLAALRHEANQLVAANPRLAASPHFSPLFA